MSPLVTRAQNVYRTLDTPDHVSDRLRIDTIARPLSHLVQQWRWLGIPASGELVELQLIAPSAADPVRAEDLRRKHRLNPELGEYRPSARYARVDGIREALALVRFAAENHQYQGLYLIPNELKAAVASKAHRNKWLQAEKGTGTSDADIARRRVLMIDVDPTKGAGVKDISATDEERDLAIERAALIYRDLAALIGEAHFALVSSGNGAQVHVRVDLDTSAETTAKIKKLLAVLGVLYTTSTETVDLSVCDPKRIFPLCGTEKRKGLDDAANGRIHRLVTFWASTTTPEILDAEGLDRLVESLSAQLTCEQLTLLDTPKKSLPVPNTTTRVDTDWSTFSDRVDQISIAQTMQWLGTEGVCPGCGSSSGADDLTPINGTHLWKCQHASCADKGLGSGRYSNRHLVIEVRRSEVEEITRTRGKDPQDPKALYVSASYLLADQFGVDRPRTKGKVRVDPKPLIASLTGQEALDSDDVLSAIQAIATLDTALQRDSAVETIKTKFGLKSTQVRAVLSTVGALRKAAKKEDPKEVTSDVPAFVRGDHVELADRLEAAHTGATYTEGQFWAYSDHKWTELRSPELSRELQSFAGARLGEGGRLSITSGSIKGSLQCYADRIDDPQFFSDSPGTVSFLNGVLKVTADGDWELVPHSPEHRCRFGYDFDFYDGGHSRKLISACREWFRGDADALAKSTALLEHLGLTILGFAPQLGRAAVYYGPLANNGKSTAAAVFRGCIPGEYVSSLSPQQLGEKFSVAELAGKRANIMDDLPTKAILDAETLKIAITGKNPIKAERKGQDPFSFLPEAGWLVCGNTLPRSDDPTEGFFRRWLVITFSRVFDPRTEIKNIEASILTERDQIVSMAIAAACEALARGSYTIPDSHNAIMTGWRDGEPARGFVAAQCESVTSGHGSSLASLYEAYCQFAEHNGFKKMNSNSFSQRLDNLGLRKRTNRGMVYLVRLREPAVYSLDDELPEPIKECAPENDETTQPKRYRVMEIDDVLRAFSFVGTETVLLDLADDPAAFAALQESRVREPDGDYTYPSVTGELGIGKGGRKTLYDWRPVNPEPVRRPA